MYLCNLQTVLMTPNSFDRPSTISLSQYMQQALGVRARRTRRLFITELGGVVLPTNIFSYCHFFQVLEAKQVLETSYQTVMPIYNHTAI